jgi:hypothetical protein
MSVTMFDQMLTSYSLKGEFAKYGLTEQDITFIKEQIHPKNNVTGKTRKEIVKEI